MKDMKKYVALFIAVVFFGLGQAFAGTPHGVKVLSTTIGKYFVGKKFEVTSLKGNHYWVVGPGGSRDIAFAPETIDRLDKVNTNPASGDSLISVCPNQAEALQEVMNAPAETSAANAPAYCKDCWPRNPTGNYTTLAPYQGVRMVWNINPSYPACSISYKIEYQNSNLDGWNRGTGWGPTIIIRNANSASCDQSALLSATASHGLDYMSRAFALKQGKAGHKGDSCYEVTVLRNGMVIKNESSPQAPW